MPPPPPVDSTSSTGNTMVATLSSIPFGGCPEHHGRGWCQVVATVTISTWATFTQWICAVSPGVTLSKEGPMELDSHADTCCAGSNCTILEYTSKVCVRL
jgi:hypothetical protein